MINKQELRIGNIVCRVEIGYDTVVGISEDGIHFPDGDIKPFDTVEPIPITEKLLERLTFSENYQGVYVKGDLDVERDVIDSPIWCVSINEIDTSIAIRFLHELQNWNYLVNGDELEVKP